MNNDNQTDPDDFQQAWRAHLSQTRVTTNADLLRKEVQLNQQNFRVMIFSRDFREIVIALLMIPLWFYLGSKWALPWTWYLTVPVMIWIAGFMLVYRWRHKQPADQPDDPLVDCVQRSLTEQEDQIWLLRNILWWYLLPPSISILAFFVQVSWSLRSTGRLALINFVGLCAFLGVLYGFVYFLNQLAVRLQLEPKRQALLTLLASLTEETANDDGRELVTVSVASLADASLTRPSAPPTRLLARLARMVCAFAIFGLLVAGMVYKVNMDQHSLPSVADLKTLPELLSDQSFQKSPFSGVRWRDSLPEVQLGDEWFKLVSLDELPAAEIVSFSRRIYGDQWHKRFEEDLVELLTGMKHPPGDTVTLVVQSLTTAETQVRKEVPMTPENRKAIRNTAKDQAISQAQPQAEAEEEPQQQPKTRTAVSIDDTKGFKERIDQFLQLAQVNAGFSGVVLVAKEGEPVYQGAFGFSHLASRTPNSLDTPFLIAALSQPFTAAAIFSLEADGALSVDDPVYRYLPEFEAEPYREITIYHLLTHTSGLPLIPEGASQANRWFAMSKAPTPVNDYVQLACECPLKFKPGQRVLYTNLGYQALSAIITLVTGTEYADFMQQRLFDPLDLKQTGVARISQPEVEAKVAESASYRIVGQGTHHPIFVRMGTGHNFGTWYGSAAIYSSANDLLRWDRIFADDSLLSAEQKTRLFQPFKQHFACGWIVQSDPDGRTYQVNTGANQGYFSRMMRIPEDELVIIALGNVHKSQEIDDALEQLFLLCRSLPYQDL